MLRAPLPTTLNYNLAIHSDDPFWIVQKDQASLSAVRLTTPRRPVQTGRLRSSWPLCLFSSAANQRSPVLSTIRKASSNRVKPSSTCPAISHAAARRAILWGLHAPVAREAAPPLRSSDIPSATSPFLTLTQPRQIVPIARQWGKPCSVVTTTSWSTHSPRAALSPTSRRSLMPVAKCPAKDGG